MKIYGALGVGLFGKKGLEGRVDDTGFPVCKIIWVCLADDDDDDDIAFPLEENKKLQNGFKVYSTI